MPFQIHSQMYHTQGLLLAHQLSKAKYAQLYAYNLELGTSIRSLKEKTLKKERR
jgi:hypothetical protein